jgi:hypothetical protein
MPVVFLSIAFSSGKGYVDRRDRMAELYFNEPLLISPYGIVALRVV